MKDTSNRNAVPSGGNVVYEQRITALEAEVKRLQEALLDVILQACQSGTDGDIDSMAISSYADAMRILGECGLIEIDVDVFRRVIAYLPGKTPK